MPRVSSHKTRQAILIRDPVFDPDVEPERIALFDEDGNMVSVNVEFLGPWNATQGYSENQLVEYDGSSYINILPVTVPEEGSNITPPLDTAHWSLIAAKGAPGIIGLTWQDVWDPGTTYVYRDAVTFEGASWMARYENLNVEPGTSSADIRAPNGTDPAALITATEAFEVLANPATMDNNKVYWWRFDVVDAGVYTATMKAGNDPYMGITDATGAYVGGGAVHAPTKTATLTPGRYYVRCQTYSSNMVAPWRVTLTPSDTIVEPPGDAWLLLAERGTDGLDGDTGPVGPTGPPGPVANWMGEFSMTQTYERGDTVSYEGSMWWATDDIPAGAVIPGADFAWTNLGDLLPISGTQHVYELPLDMVVAGPVGTVDSGYSVSGPESNFFRIHAEPGSNLTIHIGPGRFTAFRSDGSYANRYIPTENTNTDKTVLVDANGIVFLEVGSGSVGGPYTVSVEGTPNPAYPVPTWESAASKGDPGEGVPVGGATDKILRKKTGADYDTEWVDRTALDTTAMHFKGAWSSGSPYLQGDVVIDSGGLYILSAGAVAAGATAPSAETAAVDSISVTSLDGGTRTCKRIKNAGASVVQTVGLSYWFWDLSVGGTVTQSDSTVPPRQYNQMFDASKANIGSSALGGTLTKTGLAAGRYYSKVQSADVSDPYNTAPSLALSAGAVLDDGGPKWTKIATIT